MRISKVTGLAVAAVATMGALAAGGVAYANASGGGGNDGDLVVRIESTEGVQPGAVTPRDCPGKSGQEQAPEANL
jgi:hypothetical protein